MLDMHTQALGLKPMLWDAQSPPPRRAELAPLGTDSPLLARWYELMLDEIDYGVLLLGSDAQVLHINHAARCELDAQHPLQLLGRQLRARDPADVVRLHDALQARHAARPAPAADAGPGRAPRGRGGGAVAQRRAGPARRRRSCRWASARCAAA